MSIIGWEWALGTTLHYFRWGGNPEQRGLHRVTGLDFQVAFNPVRE
jgi:hypothetical protein